MLPVLTQAAEVWGYHSSPNDEIFFSKSSLPSNSVGQTVYLGRVPMYVYRKLIMIKYWLNFLTMSEHSILFKVYNMSKIDADNNNTYNKKKTWHIILKHI